MPRNPDDERTPADTEKPSNSTQPLKTSSKGEGSVYSGVASGTTSEEEGTPGESFQSNESNGWTILNDGMKEFEEGMLEKWRNELDNLLVFAGLFSAVVTAFTIESYKWLQEDSSDTSAKLLANISLQLSSFIANPGFINSSFRVPPSSDHTSTQFTPDALSINVNTLWFASLSLSLIAAFYTIAVQQWLRSYSIPSNLPVRTSVRFRQFRHDGLEQWHVPMIVSLLPILIQIAVGLFFAGLFLLLQSLNATVATAFALLAGIPLLLFGLSVIAPLIWASCPYKSLILPTTWMFLKWCLLPLFAIFYQIAHLTYELTMFIIYHIRSFKDSTIAWNAGELASHIMSKVIHWWFELRKHYAAAGIGRFWDDRDRVVCQRPSVAYAGDRNSLSRSPNLLSQHDMSSIFPCLDDLTGKWSQMHVALDIAAQTLGDFSEIDYGCYNDVDFVNPALLEQVDVTFPLEIEESLFTCISNINEASQMDWIAEGPDVTSIMLLLHHLASLEGHDANDEVSDRIARLSPLLLQLCCNEGRHTIASTAQGWFPAALLYRCCVEQRYIPTATELDKLSKWILTVSKEAEHCGDTFEIIQVILASCACALHAIVHSDSGRPDFWTIHQLVECAAKFIFQSAAGIRRVGRLSTRRSVHSHTHSKRPGRHYITPQAVHTIAQLLPNLRGLEPRESSGDSYDTSVQKLADALFGLCNKEVVFQKASDCLQKGLSHPPVVRAVPNPQIPVSWLV